MMKTAVFLILLAIAGNVTAADWGRYAQGFSAAPPVLAAPAPLYVAPAPVIDIRPAQLTLQEKIEANRRLFYEWKKSKAVTLTAEQERAIDVRPASTPAALDPRLAPPPTPPSPR